ncbi:MAG: hypothetical protein R3A10_02320 [Caldilineaceae bacterium]
MLDNLAEQAPDPDEYDVAHTWPDVQVTHFETLTATPISSGKLPVEPRFQGKADAMRKLRCASSAIGRYSRQVANVPLADEVEVNLFVRRLDAVPGPYQLRMMIYDEETLEPIRTTDGADLVTLDRSGRPRSEMRLPYLTKSNVRQCYLEVALFGTINVAFGVAKVAERGRVGDTVGADGGPAHPLSALDQWVTVRSLPPFSSTNFTCHRAT